MARAASLLEQTDEQLMLTYQSGEMLAFEELYRRNSGRVYGFLKKKLKKREEADDVFQQVFAKLHQSRAGYNSEYLFSQWIFVIANTVLVDHWRRLKRSPGQPGKLDFEETEIPQELTAGEGGDQSFDDQTAAALEGLPADQAQAIMWRTLDDLSYEEIAKRMNRSQESIRQMVSRGLRKMKISLAGTGGMK